MRRASSSSTASPRCRSPGCGRSARGSTGPRTSAGRSSALRAQVLVSQASAKFEVDGRLDEALDLLESARILGRRVRCRRGARVGPGSARAAAAASGTDRTRRWPPSTRPQVLLDVADPNDQDPHPAQPGRAAPRTRFVVEGRGGSGSAASRLRSRGWRRRSGTDRAAQPRLRRLPRRTVAEGARADRVGGRRAPGLAPRPGPCAARGRPGRRRGDDPRTSLRAVRRSASPAGPRGDRAGPRRVCAGGRKRQAGKGSRTFGVPPLRPSAQPPLATEGRADAAPCGPCCSRREGPSGTAYVTPRGRRPCRRPVRRLSPRGPSRPCADGVAAGAGGAAPGGATKRRPRCRRCGRCRPPARTGCRPARCGRSRPGARARAAGPRQRSGRAWRSSVRTSTRSARSTCAPRARCTARRSPGSGCEIADRERVTHGGARRDRAGSRDLHPTAPGPAAVRRSDRGPPDRAAHRRGERARARGRCRLRARARAAANPRSPAAEGDPGSGVGARGRPRRRRVGASVGRAAGRRAGVGRGVRDLRTARRSVGGGGRSTAAVRACTTWPRSPRSPGSCSGSGRTSTCWRCRPLPPPLRRRYAAASTSAWPGSTPCVRAAPARRPARGAVLQRGAAVPAVGAHPGPRRHLHGGHPERRDLAPRDGAEPAPQTPRVLAVAGPDLRLSTPEATAVAGIWEGAEALVGEAATAAATHAGLVRSDLLHVAAHGVHRPESPLFSSVRLSDGPLFAYEIDPEEGLAGCVFLSACEAGLATTRPGDENLGLASVLLQLGTTTVVAGVARVNDEVSAGVMTSGPPGLCNKESTCLPRLRPDFMRLLSAIRPLRCSASALVGDVSKNTQHSFVPSVVLRHHSAQMCNAFLRERSLVSRTPPPISQNGCQVDRGPDAPDCGGTP